MREKDLKKQLDVDEESGPDPPGGPAQTLSPGLESPAKSSIGNQDLAGYFKAGKGRSLAISIGVLAAVVGFTPVSAERLLNSVAQLIESVATNPTGATGVLHAIVVLLVAVVLARGTSVQHKQ